MPHATGEEAGVDPAHARVLLRGQAEGKIDGECGAQLTQAPAEELTRADGMPQRGGHRHGQLEEEDAKPPVGEPRSEMLRSVPDPVPQHVGREDHNRFTHVPP